MDFTTPQLSKAQQTPRAKANPKIDPDCHLLLEVLQNNRAKLEVDWDTVAKKLGLKNAASARARFGQTTKKLVGLSGGATTGPSMPGPSIVGSAKAAKATTKRKRDGTDATGVAENKRRMIRSLTPPRDPLYGSEDEKSHKAKLKQELKEEFKKEADVDRKDVDSDDDVSLIGFGPSSLFGNVKNKSFGLN